MSIKSQVIEVTPQKAEAWLQNRGKNRTVSQSHVQALASAMSAGRWVLNGQSICFNDEGKLIDGQHRLSAVVLSGVTVKMLIVSGIYDDSAFETYDTTIRKRNVSQIITMENYAHASTAAAVAKRLAAWEKTSDKSRFSLTSEIFNRMPNHAILDAVRKNKEEIESLINQIASSSSYRKCGAGSALVTALIICNRIDDVRTLLFADSLSTGEKLTKQSPIYHLREKLIDPPARRSSHRYETEIMALTIKAWNYYAQDKPMKVLRWRQDGDAPEKFPVPIGGLN